MNGRTLIKLNFSFTRFFFFSLFSLWLSSIPFPFCWMFIQNKVSILFFFFSPFVSVYSRFLSCKLLAMFEALRIRRIGLKWIRLVCFFFRGSHSRLKWFIFISLQERRKKNTRLWRREKCEPIFIFLSIGMERCDSSSSFLFFLFTEVDVFFLFFLRTFFMSDVGQMRCNHAMWTVNEQTSEHWPVTIESISNWNNE